MSTDNNTPTTPTAPATSADLQSSVDALVTQKTSGILDGIVEKLADKVIEQRSEALTKAFRDLKATAASRDQYKPDASISDASGKVLTEGYSAPVARERKRFQDSIDKIDAAVTAAMGGDFSKLRELGYNA